MVLDVVWQECLKCISAEIGSRVVETWFKAVSLVSWDTQTKTMQVRAPNTFIKEWVETHYQHILQQHLGRLLNESALGVTLVAEKTVPFRTSSSTDTPSEKKTSQSKAPSEKGKDYAYTPAVVSSTKGLLQQSHKFESFVVGPHNSMAYAAAHAVVESPGSLYNPLLIWGRSGMGKTHLLHAIGHQFKAGHTKATIVYQSADRFVHEFTSAARAHSLGTFEARYKGIDLLLMDDIQYISHKTQTQEMFFQIFNTLYQARKQIVFTSNVPPHDIVGVAERIRSRLEGGLVTDIQEAALDTRIAIVHKKAAAYTIELDAESAHLIAVHRSSTIRDIEGSLIRVLAFASFTRQPITHELIRNVLVSTADTKGEKADLPQVLRSVAHQFNYSVDELKSAKRTKDLVLARHVAIYLMKKMTNRSLREIALFLEKKDHSTILHAYTKLQEQRNHNHTLAALIEQCEQEIVRNF